MIKDTVNKLSIILSLALLTSCAVRLDKHFSPHLISKLEQEKNIYKKCNSYSKSLTDSLEKARTLDKQYNFPRDLVKAEQALDLLDSSKIDLQSHYEIQKKVVTEIKNMDSIRAYYTYYQDLPICGLYNESIFLETIAVDINQENYPKDFVNKARKKVKNYLKERIEKPSSILFLGYLFSSLLELSETKFIKIDSLKLSKLANNFSKEEEKNSSNSRFLYQDNSLESFEKLKSKMTKELGIIDRYTNSINKLMVEPDHKE